MTDRRVLVVAHINDHARLAELLARRGIDAGRIELVVPDDPRVDEGKALADTLLSREVRLREPEPEFDLGFFIEKKRIGEIKGPPRSKKDRQRIFGK